MKPRDINVPFCWAEKAALRRIRTAFGDTTYLDQALAVYSTHCELASDAQSPTYTESIRKIMERSGVGRTRVHVINKKFRSLKLVDWKQNPIDGTKELGNSTYTLLNVVPPVNGVVPPADEVVHKPQNASGESSKESPEQSPEESLEALRGIAIKNPGVVELMERCASIFGEGEMKRNHRRWYGRATKEAGKLRRVLDDIEDRILNGLDNPAAYTESIWKVFK